ncbi:MAG: hypothetical protein IPM11_12480 [Micropruina sp.]|nr:hypothetical protein [Micropruina sp.]
MTTKNHRERMVSRRTLAVGAAWTIPAVAVAAAAPAVAASCSGTATVLTYNNTGGANSYTGVVRTVTIPATACRVIDFELWGGNSGATVYGNTGRGTKITGQLTLPAGAVTLSLIVGGGGAGHGIAQTTIAPGGWGYGKGGDVAAQSNANLSGSWAGAGGGGSAIKVGANLVVAAGGGGGGATAIMTAQTGCTAYSCGGVVSWGGSGYGTGSPVGYQTLYMQTSTGTHILWADFNGGSNGSGGTGGIGGAVTNFNSLGAPYFPSPKETYGAWAGSAGGNIGAGSQSGGDGAAGTYGSMSGTNGSPPITESVGVGGAGGGGYGGGGSGGCASIYDYDKCQAGAWGGSGGGAGGNYVGGGGGVGLRGLAYGINPGGDSANGYVKLTYYV